MAVTRIVASVVEPLETIAGRGLQRRCIDGLEPASRGRLREPVSASGPVSGRRGYERAMIAAADAGPATFTTSTA